MYTIILLLYENVAVIVEFLNKTNAFFLVGLSHTWNFLYFDGSRFHQILRTPSTDLDVRIILRLPSRPRLKCRARTPRWVWQEAAGRQGVGQLPVNDLLLQRDGEHIILCILPDRSSNVLSSKHLLTIVVKVFFRDAPRPIWILQQIRFTLLDRFLVRNRKIPQIVFNCYDSITVVAFVRSLRALHWC